MKRSAVLIAVALSCLVVSGTAARARIVFRAGNELYEQCNSNDAVLIGNCSGYIVGVYDTLSEGEVCITAGPSGVNAGQLRDVVKLYLHDHPERRNFSASSLVTDALKEKFPCN